jgi:hypothetical protein
MSNLASVRSKIDRANHHLRDIDTALKLLIGDDPNAQHPAVFERETDRKLVTVKLKECEPIDPSLPLIIGDCIHNLRSALDHLVYQLALKNKSVKKFADKTFFPIYLTDTKFDDRVEKLVKPFISGPALTKIKECQPYSAYDVPDESDIWVLSQLDILDKHRLLLVAAQKFAVTEFTLTLPNGEQRHQIIPNPKWKAVKNGAEVIRFRFAVLPGKVRVQIKMVTTIQFINTGLACDGVFVQDALRQCVAIVTAIVGDFGKTFFGE